MTNTHLEELLAGQPADVQAEILRINTDARPIALQIALLIPLLAALLGLVNGFRMTRLPTPSPRRPPRGYWPADSATTCRSPPSSTSVGRSSHDRSSPLRAARRTRRQRRGTIIAKPCSSRLPRGRAWLLSSFGGHVLGVGKTTYGDVLGVTLSSAVPARRSLTRFQTMSRATARSVIATMAPKVSGAFRSVSTAKNTSTTAVTAIPSRTIAGEAPVCDRSR